MFTVCARQRLPRLSLDSFREIQIRKYALSRHPKRAIGAGRNRDVDCTTLFFLLLVEIQLKKTIENATESPQYAPAKVKAISPARSTDDTGLTGLLMDRDVLVIERQLEMLNVFIGFEQCNKYTISDINGKSLGYIAEEPRGFWGSLSRQAFATHRPFRAVIMDKAGTPVLHVQRPFSWINSRMFVQRPKIQSDSSNDADINIERFGEVQQVWHLWRRRYDLFLQETLPTSPHPEKAEEHEQSSQFCQIAKIDSGFLAWTFRVLTEKGMEIAKIERGFAGFGREIFTDTGVYSVHFRSSEVQSSLLPGSPEISSANLSQNHLDELNVDARSLLLALAVNIDFDYFSRHSEGGGGGGLFSGMMRFPSDY